MLKRADAPCCEPISPGPALPPTGGRRLPLPPARQPRQIALPVRPRDRGRERLRQFSLAPLEWVARAGQSRYEQLHQRRPRSLGTYRTYLRQIGQLRGKPRTQALREWACQADPASSSFTVRIGHPVADPRRGLLPRQRFPAERTAGAAAKWQGTEENSAGSQPAEGHPGVQPRPLQWACAVVIHPRLHISALAYLSCESPDTVQFRQRTQLGVGRDQGRPQLQGRCTDQAISRIAMQKQVAARQQRDLWRDGQDLQP